MGSIVSIEYKNEPFSSQDECYRRDLELSLIGKPRANSNIRDPLFHNRPKGFLRTYLHPPSPILHHSSLIMALLERRICCRVAGRRALAPIGSSRVHSTLFLYLLSKTYPCFIIIMYNSFQIPIEVTTTVNNITTTHLLEQYKLTTRYRQLPQKAIFFRTKIWSLKMAISLKRKF